MCTDHSLPSENCYYKYQLVCEFYFRSFFVVAIFPSLTLKDFLVRIIYTTDVRYANNVEAMLDIVTLDEPERWLRRRYYDFNIILGLISDVLLL